MRMLDRVDDRCAFEATMDHAILALLILPDAILVPIGAFDEFLERLHVAFAEQVARFLPAEHATQRHRPGRALISLVAGQEIEEQGRLGEFPFLATVAARED